MVVSLFQKYRDKSLEGQKISLFIQSSETNSLRTSGSQSEYPAKDYSDLGTSNRQSSFPTKLGELDNSQRDTQFKQTHLSKFQIDDQGYLGLSQSNNARNTYFILNCSDTLKIQESSTRSSMNPIMKSKK